MNKIARLLLFLVFIFNNSNVFGCSCLPIPSFCDFLQREESSLVLKGQVIDTIEYSFENIAVYFKVERVFRDDFGITSDTIKIYGSRNPASCGLNVIKKMPLFEDVFIAIGKEEFPENNPDSIFNQFYEIKTSLCFARILENIYGTLRGYIASAENTGDSISIYQYPVTHFEQDLIGCQFKQEPILTDNCREDNYIIFPNPITETSFFRIRNIYSRYRTKEIRIFSIDGRFLFAKKINNNEYDSFVRVNFLNNGIYVIEIESSLKTVYRRLIINK